MHRCARQLSKRLANVDPDLRRSVLPPLLDDSVLAVRIEAARALVGAPEQSLTTEQRARFNVVLDEYIAAQTYNFDRPEGHMNVGNLAAARGDAEAAIAQYQQAMAIDPLFVAAYVNLADIYRCDRQRGGRAGDPAAGPQGRSAFRGAASHVGLALTRQKARDVALQEFKTAVQLAPNDARFAYVYAVALNDSGRQADALSVLKTALKANPYDRESAARAWCTSRKPAGDGKSAKQYAALLRELDPDNPEWVQLQQQLDGAVSN